MLHSFDAELAPKLFASSTVGSDRPLVWPRAATPHALDAFASSCRWEQRDVGVHFGQRQVLWARPRKVLTE